MGPGRTVTDDLSESQHLVRHVGDLLVLDLAEEVSGRPIWSTEPHAHGDRVKTGPDHTADALHGGVAPANGMPEYDVSRGRDLRQHIRPRCLDACGRGDVARLHWRQVDRPLETDGGRCGRSSIVRAVATHNLQSMVPGLTNELHCRDAVPSQIKEAVRTAARVPGQV